MRRPAHFLDPYQFQIEEMVKLGCSDEHIHKVLHDIQKVEFTQNDLIRYMDENGIRKRMQRKDGRGAKKLSGKSFASSFEEIKRK